MAVSASLQLLLLILPLVLSHPQCLDFQPPYTDPQVSYCTEYAEFGCCWRVTDRQAGKRVSHLLTRTSTGRKVAAECEPYLKNVSCTTCSPYAAHLFDRENYGKGQTFPWLCRDYCEEAYQNCRDILLRMYRIKPSDFNLVKNPKSPETLVEDAKNFCSEIIPYDSPYCYPRVLDGPQINGEVVKASGNLSCLCALPVATGLRSPVFAVHSGDQTGRLFIGEQVGVVWVLMANNTRLPVPFLDIESQVLSSDRIGEERGLLGMAFHPNFKENGRFFVYFSMRINNRHYSRVSEYRVSTNDSNQSDPASERVILQLQQPHPNQNGGQLLFKDGYLLVFFGNGGLSGENAGDVQTRRSWLGSILRVDVDNKDEGKEYAVPPDNPFVNDPEAAPEVYAYGFRNPWRCSVDRGDRDTRAGRGRVFCGDVGQDLYEEVNIIEEGGNYGWPAYEGNTCFDPDLCAETNVDDLVSPIDVYDHLSVGVSVTGGYVYRGCLFPNLRGLYIFGDYGTGTLFGLREDNGEWERIQLCMGDSRECTGDLVGTERKKFIISFGEDEDGELYVMTTSSLSSGDDAGVVYQLVDPSRRTRPIECKRNIKTLNYHG